MATPISGRSPESRQHGPRSGRNRRAAQVSKRRLSTFLGNAAFGLLGVAVLVLGAALVVASQPHPASSASGSTQKGIGAQAQAANAQMMSGDWIPLRSKAPSDILAAARQSSLFQENLSGSGDHVSNLSRLGTPVFVRALQPPGAVAGQYPDFYVVPILDASGAATDAAELALNPTHTAVHVIAIVTYSKPHTHGAISSLSAAMAVAAVKAQQHSTLRPNAALQLVYFPADAVAFETGSVKWTGGGVFPADPIWLVPGSDGRDHLVGVDGRAYYLQQLPMISSGR